MSNENTWKEYEHVFQLEQEMNKSRWMVFTAFLSVSFIIAGLILREMSSLGPVVGKSGMAFGWLVFMAGFYHYWWFHRRSHQLRRHLCELEDKLFIRVFKIRTERPEIAGIKIYYHWAIDLMAISYTLLLGLVLFG